MRKIKNTLHPELAPKKIDQSISNMMLSNKGSSLDIQKQMTQLGLKIKGAKGIPKSASTLFEKLELDKKALETEEQRAIFNMLLLIKQNLERDQGVKLAESSFQDLSVFADAPDEYIPKNKLEEEEEEERKELFKTPTAIGSIQGLARAPLRQRGPTKFEQMQGKGE